MKSVRMWLLRVLGLEYFAALLPIFFAIYAVGNATTIMRDAEFLAPTIGSYAQFCLPIAAAAGAYLASSPHAIGIGFAQRTAARNPVLWDLRILLHFLSLIAIYLTLAIIGLSLAVLSKGGAPKIDAGHALYPLAASVLGLGIGYLFGTGVSRVWRATAVSSLAVFAVSIGLVTFLCVVAGKELFGLTTRYSLALGAMVVDPSQVLNSSVVFGQIALGVGLGCLTLAWAGILRFIRWRQPLRLLGVVAIAGMLTMWGLVQVRSSGALLQDRFASDFECVGGTIRVCSFPEELRGAELLVDAMEMGYRDIPGSYRPTEVIQKGLAATPHTPNPLDVLEMPNSDRSAAIYAAEFIARAAGCGPDDVSNSPEIVQLLTTVRQSAVSESTDLVDSEQIGEGLTALHVVCKK